MTNSKQNDDLAADQAAENANPPKVETIQFDKMAGENDSSSTPTTAELLAEEKNKYLLLLADMQNLRTRTAREVLNERQYGAQPIIKDLLPVLDNVTRAIEAADENEASNAGLLEGFKLVQQQILSILTQHKCVLIEALGVEFNPDLHEAILQQPSEEQASGIVLMVTQAGYQLHDRVVRPAQVIVSSGPVK